MTVTAFDEIHSGRDGGEEITGRKSARRYTRVFRATTNSNNDDAATILLYVDCPVIGQVHPNDLYAWCRRVQPRNESFSKRVWLVTAVYSTEQEHDEDPRNDPVTVVWGTDIFQQPVWKDIDKKSIVNSAGSFFDPSPEKDDRRLTATITATAEDVPTYILNTNNLVNKDTFVLDGIEVPAGLAKIGSVGVSEPQRRNDISFRTVTIRVQFRPRAPLGDDERGKEWHLWLQDAGFEEKGDDGNMKKILLAGDSTEPTEPWPLDGNGHAILKPTLEDVVFLNFKIYPQDDYITLIPGCTKPD